MPERQQYPAQPNGRVVASRERGVPGTPSRKDKLRESLAVQDPGLKDYVGASLPLFPLREDCSRVWGDGKLDCVLTWRPAPRRMLGQGCLWRSLQGLQLGDGRGCCGEADQADRPAKERATDD